MNICILIIIKNYFNNFYFDIRNQFRNLKTEYQNRFSGDEKFILIKTLFFGIFQDIINLTNWIFSMLSLNNHWKIKRVLPEMKLVPQVDSIWS